MDKMVKDNQYIIIQMEKSQIVKKWENSENKDKIQKG